MIYLSPHYDDAVLSCGGLMRLQGRNQSVKVFTVFGLPMGDRCQEDQRATRYLGAVPVIGPRYEAMYREGFDPKTVLDFDLNGVLPGSSVTDPFRIPPDMFFSDLMGHEIYCPLGIGGHVDHVVVRRLVSMLSLDVWYWEDIPYCFSRDVAPWTVGMTSKVIPIGRHSAEFKIWMDAVSRYTSQIPSLFGTTKNMIRQYSDYLDSTGGIRLWRRT